MKHISILLFVFLFATQVFGQPSEKADHKLVAANQVKQLKNGALIVRLKSKKLLIDNLSKNGNQELAKKIERMQAQENRVIMDAFRKEFSFCKVYFMLSDYSKNVMEKQLDKIIFLNDSLRLDSTIKISETAFLITEFTNIAPDNSELSSKDSSALNKQYAGGTTMGFEALIMKSDYFIQLKHPFPYYVRTYNTFPIIKRKPKKTVRLMNRKLHNYYSNVMGIKKPQTRKWEFRIMLKEK